MLDIKLIRENLALVEENLKKRHDPEKIKLLHEVVRLDKERRDIIQDVEKLKQHRNVVTKEVAELKAKGKKVDTKLKEVKDIPEKIKKLDDKLHDIEEESRLILLTIPNMLDEGVPFGKDEGDNVEVRRHGEEPHFDFEPKNHLEILTGLGLIDEERAAKVSGAGFMYLKGDLVILDIALQRFAMDFLMKRGFTLVNPPYMINRKPYEGVIDLSDFEAVTYKVDGVDSYLIATSEHPLISMYMNETIEKKNLPIKLIGVSPCFRKEVGTHGKYTKGLFRMHQFNKVEQIVFSMPEESFKIHEELQSNSEDMYNELGLCYRVVNVCTGDIGSIAAKKYDIEFWMADGQFREIGSNSNCTDYQSRRLNIRYREKEGVAPSGFVHTLNNTGFATSRVMIAILEQFQRKDGTVDIPKALWPYTGFKRLEK